MRYFLLYSVIFSCCYARAWFKK